MRINVWSISLLAVSFFIFTIGIPIAQNKIDNKLSSNEQFKFNVQQVLFANSSWIDKYDTGSYLDLILKDKLIDEKYNGFISEMKVILEERCRVLLVGAIALIVTNPEGKAENFKKIQSALNNFSSKELLNIFSNFSNKPLAISTKFYKDIIFWKNIRTCLYAIAGSFFIGGTILQIWSLFHIKGTL